MNNEIKEILDFKEDADYKRLSVDEITMLRDYITNLQEELQAYKQERENILDKSKRLNYKLRIDKAIECINYYAIENSDYEKIYNIEEETLLNILGGKDG